MTDGTTRCMATEASRLSCNFELQISHQARRRPGTKQQQSQTFHLALMASGMGNLCTVKSNLTCEIISWERRPAALCLFWKILPFLSVHMKYTVVASIFLARILNVQPNNSSCWPMALNWKAMSTFCVVDSLFSDIL